MLIGARNSPLSKAQVAEIKKELSIDFETIFISTIGDLDQKTSLRTLEKTNFFTKELDEMLLTHKIDAAVHSAKDLPDPLPSGLVVCYLSKGLDPRDALVFNKEPIRLVATSSKRREESVLKLYPNCKFIDLRGTIHKRLELLDQGIDGVVVAECALQRLKLTHLNRVFLPEPTTEGQGKLAIVCREEDLHLWKQNESTLSRA
jgi:hydroxymethylbilane synthase